jgi:hypothetical protein
MFRRVTARITYANVISSLALFIALGGGAYALSIPKASVGSKQLKSKAVTNSKIANGAVTSAKVKDDSLTGSDIKESTLGKVPSASAADAATAAITATTAATATNALALGGKPAAGFISKVVVRSKSLDPLTNGSTVGGAGDGGTNDGTVHCAAGERAIGGGARNAASGEDQAIISSRPTDATSAGVPADGTAATGWRTVVSDQGDSATDNPTDITVFVICAS